MTRRSLVTLLIVAFSLNAGAVTASKLGLWAAVANDTCSTAQKACWMAPTASGYSLATVLILVALAVFTLPVLTWLFRLSCKRTVVRTSRGKYSSTWVEARLHETGRHPAQQG